MRLTYKLAALTGLIAFAADQASKYALLQEIDFGTAREIVVLPFFSLVKWWNEGVSFGMFNGSEGSGLQRLLLTGVTLLIVGGLVRWLLDITRRVPAIAIGGIIGGALGNLLDRFHYGAVADFLYFHVDVGGHRYGYPAFNIGDSCIVVGVALLLFDSFRKSPTAETVDEKP